MDTNPTDMKRYWPVAVIGLAILVLLGLFWVRAEKVQAPEQPSADGPAADGADPAGTARDTYRSEAFGFSFRYPAALDVQAYTPSTIAVGTETPGGFEAEVEVSVAESGEEGGYGSFNEFIFDWGRLLCAADGPGESLNCDRVERREPFTMSTGLAGEAYYFRLVRTNVVAGTETYDTFGPVYAFNLGANVPASDFAALLVYVPLAIYGEGTDQALARDIASSLIIDRTGNR